MPTDDKHNHIDTRVVVTGLGVISPIGLGISEFHNSLNEGCSGVGPITQFDCEAADPKSGKPQFRSRIAAEVRDFSAEQIITRANRLDRASQFALVAANMASQDAGLDSLKSDPTRIGVVLGTGMGDMRTVEWGIELLRNGRVRRIPPTSVPKVLPSSMPSHVAMYLGVSGPSLAVSTACASSTHAVGEAYWMIRRGDADLIITGGADASITPLTVSGFAAMRVLSTRNEEPTRASRPFDRDRDGFVFGEGAGILVLERLSSALERKARIHGEMIGYGTSCDAYHLTGMRPDGVHCARAIEVALERSGIAPEAVDYVNAHGSSTPINDVTETKAIKLALGEHARRIPISATKSMVGHLLSAAGAVELIATLLALETQKVHPTINLEEPDPECDLDYVPGGSRYHSMRVAVKNSFGLGGHNAVLVIRKWVSDCATE